MVYLYFFGYKTRPRGKEEEIEPDDFLPSVSMPQSYDRIDATDEILGRNNVAEDLHRTSASSYSALYALILPNYINVFSHYVAYVIQRLSRMLYGSRTE